jgi:hypothetical protein
MKGRYGNKPACGAHKKQSQTKPIYLRSAFSVKVRKRLLEKTKPIIA